MHKFAQNVVSRGFTLSSVIKPYYGLFVVYLSISANLMANKRGIVNLYCLASSKMEIDFLAWKLCIICSNTCNTIIEKTSKILHLFYFYSCCILIGLNLDKSTYIKRQFIFDFTSFNRLKRPN